MDSTTVMNMLAALDEAEFCTQSGTEGCNSQQEHSDILEVVAQEILAPRPMTAENHVAFSSDKPDIYIHAEADNEVREDNSEFVVGTALDTEGSDSGDLHPGVPGSRELGYQKP